MKPVCGRSTQGWDPPGEPANAGSGLRLEPTAAIRLPRREQNRREALLADDGLHLLSLGTSEQTRCFVQSSLHAKKHLIRLPSSTRRR